MLRFERSLVASLTTSEDPAGRASTVGFVDASLRAMPEFLRLGVLVESLAFTVLGALGIRRAVRLLDAVPVSLVRQYLRLFRSLVLFAEQEAKRPA